MKVKCCRCRKEYILGDNISEYDKDTNCPILICPYCDLKHAINFMPFEKEIKVKKVKKLDLTTVFVILGASRIANASRVDKSGQDDGSIEDGTAFEINDFIKTKEYDTSAQATRSNDVFFSTDGTKMFVLDGIDNQIDQYSLSTAWDINTATWEKAKAIGGYSLGFVGMFFRADGLRLYMATVTTDDESIVQFTLSTAWDIGNIGQTGEFTVSTQDILPRDVFFKSDGLKMYVVGAENDRVYEYSLSTAWNLSTVTYVRLFDPTDEEIYPYSIFFNSDGSKMYILGGDNGTIFQYDLSTSWDISTASYDNHSYGASSYYGFYFKPDGTILYTGSSGSVVRQHDLREDWNKANDFILATMIYTSKGPIVRAYKLRWKVSGGTFADVGATGAITYSADTVLVDDASLPQGANVLCSYMTGWIFSSGRESEGDNILPDTGTFTLNDERYTEFQWALDCNGATDEATYEFELWDVTEGASCGTCLASITMAPAVGEGFKWNTKTILKWCGKVISKWNTKVGS